MAVGNPKVVRGSRGRIEHPHPPRTSRSGQSYRVRIPDVAVLDASRPQEQVPTYPPLAVFEVLSPEDRIQRMSRKLEDYERMGIRAIWVIDPETGDCSEFKDGQLMRSDAFSLPEREVSFSMREIAKRLR